jgi:phage gp36-like protein
MPLVAPTNPYATVSDLTLYGAPAAAFAANTPEQEQAAIDAANALADSYLGKRYDLPLQEWGADLVRAVAVIATYDLIVVRGSNPESPGNADLHARWQAAMDWLAGIAEQKIDPQAIVEAEGGGGGGAGGAEGEFVVSVSSGASGQFVVGPSRSGRGW